MSKPPFKASPTTGLINVMSLALSEAESARARDAFEAQRTSVIECAIRIHKQKCKPAQREFREPTWHDIAFDRAFLSAMILLGDATGILARLKWTGASVRFVGFGARDEPC
jgi:hypothetical protein